MTYSPLAVILLVLTVGAAVTLTILFYASKKGAFQNLDAEAHVIFDEDEPVGEPQDQLFRDDPPERSSSPNESSAAQ